ncbi:MAG: VWA domain-containing protein, partial [Acidobacteriota bacterium]|nr:VWA domain-containing protein [Acidobacteriota bacterium]
MQVDAVVTDKGGRHVKDLRAEDFEILEDGRPQQITNFSYVPPEPPPPAQTTAPMAPAQGERRADAPPATPVRLRPEQVRRTIVLVTDDLGLSADSLTRVRQALRTYVDEQMQPGDLVALVRTGSGVGALQGFTADRQQLYAAIERVRWSPSNSGINALAPIFLPPFTIPADRDGPREDLGLRRDLFAVGTLNALSQVISGMGRLPGRKSLVLFSEGFPLATRERGERALRLDPRDRVADAIERLADAANRASVVFYSIDPRGAATTYLTAGDDLATVMLNEGPPGVRRRLANRGHDFADSQESLNYLAQSTGGLFISSNDLPQAVRRALGDEQG